MPQHLFDPSPHETPVTPRTPDHAAPAGRLARLARGFRRLPRARRRMVGGVAAGAALLLVAGVLTPIVVTADAAGSEPVAQAATSAPATTRQSTVNTTAVTSLSSAAGSVAGGTTLTVSGVDVDSVTRVMFGEQDAVIVASTSTELTVAVPPATSFSPAQVGVSVYADDVRVDDAALSYDYGIVSAVDAQMAYVFAHWNDYNLDEYGSLYDTDCANFASQSLLARGWTMSDDWWAEGTGDAFDFSKAWVSSTYFMSYAEEHPELATALDDTQRDQVKVGDIVQFDWDNSGDRDHTGIVSKVEHTDAGIVISYAGHTDDTDYRTVDEAITVIHPGASVYYWSIA